MIVKFIWKQMMAYGNTLCLAHATFYWHYIYRSIMEYSQCNIVNNCNIVNLQILQILWQLNIAMLTMGVVSQTRFRIKSFLWNLIFLPSVIFCTANNNREKCSVCKICNQPQHKRLLLGPFNLGWRLIFEYNCTFHVINLNSNGSSNKHIAVSLPWYFLEQ